MKTVDIVIIGGGPAGLGAAIAAREKGVKNILIIERDRELGGILQQCIHNGFGLHHFKEELTGPEYAQRFIDQVDALGIDYTLNTIVLEITGNKQIHMINPLDGYRTIQAGAIILAMGCRERSRGALNIPGTRPSGVFTAGSAQRYINMEGYMVGKKLVILGSGDIGLIMARRMTLEGAKVLAVVEVMPYSGGLTRNIVQCLEDFDIPLYLSHTVTEVEGKDRVEGITISRVDDNRKPILGTEVHYDCDTLLLSVGLIPENEMTEAIGAEMDPLTKGPVVNESMETTIEGIFACGNVVHVHDLVDFVTEESMRAGRHAADYVLSHETGIDDSVVIKTIPGESIAYIVPQKIGMEHHELICLNCPMGCHLDVTISEENQWTIKGNKCKRGIDYAKSELSNPCRILTTTVRINNGFLKRIPVRTTEAIPKAIIFEAMEAINALSIEAPVKMRTVILHDLLGTGVDVVTSRDMNTYEGL